MKSGIDPDEFMSKICLLGDKVSDLDEVVSTERLTAITLDAMPMEKCSIIKTQAFKDPDLSS